MSDEKLKRKIIKWSVAFVIYAIFRFVAYFAADTTLTFFFGYLTGGAVFFWFLKCENLMLTTKDGG